VIYLSPQGKRLNQSDLIIGEQGEELILIAGRYEGVDERLIDNAIDEEWSIGDYVLSGGELPAMVVIDAMIRSIPGVLGHVDSAAEDSFSQGLLDYPHYTRPDEIDGMSVPEVLSSGNHEEIRRWRLKQALGRTWQRRPEMLKDLQLDKEQIELLDEFIHQQSEIETT
jgi:tRNA (guanine37-N1)-methyltransferase